MRFAVTLILTLLTVPALAEEAQPRKVRFDGNSMTVKPIGDNSIEIAYVDPPAALREVGVEPGSVVMRGTWNARDGILEGEAFLFAAGCPPIEYPIRGVVDELLWLIVLGPTPVLDGCTPTGKSEWSSASVMRFEPDRTLPSPADSKARKRKREEREAGDKPKEKAKPKPKPKAEHPQPRQQPQQQSPYWNYPQQYRSPYNWQ